MVKMYDTDPAIIAENIELKAEIERLEENHKNYVDSMNNYFNKTETMIKEAYNENDSLKQRIKELEEGNKIMYDEMISLGVIPDRLLKKGKKNG